MSLRHSTLGKYNFKMQLNNTFREPCTLVLFKLNKQTQTNTYTHTHTSICKVLIRTNSIGTEHICFDINSLITNTESAINRVYFQTADLSFYTGRFIQSVVSTCYTSRSHRTCKLIIIKQCQFLIVLVLNIY